MDFYEKVGTTFHLLLGLNMEAWLNMMLRKTIFGDELTLYALSRSYNRHTIVYNKNRLWCTMEIKTPMPPVDIHNNCNVHLIYIEGGLFATLRRKPETALLPLVLLSAVYEEPLDMTVHPMPTTSLVTKVQTKLTPAAVDCVYVEITVSASGKIKDIITNLDPDDKESLPTLSRVITLPDPCAKPDSVNHDDGSTGVNTSPLNITVCGMTGVNEYNLHPDSTTTNLDDPIGVNAPSATKEPELIEVLSSTDSDSTVIYDAPDEHKLAYLDKLDKLMSKTTGECFMEQYKNADENLVQALHKSTLERNACVSVSKLKTSEINRWIEKSKTETVKPLRTPLEEINYELSALTRRSRYPKRERKPRRIRSNNRALRKTSRNMSYQESGTSASEPDVSKLKVAEKADPCKRAPSLARIAAQNMITSKTNPK